MRHSPLTQISRENVKQLKVAWTYHTGDAQPGRRSTIECTPIVIDGVMHDHHGRSRKWSRSTRPPARAKWTFDPYSADAGWSANAMNGVNRGVAYWKDEKTGRGRIFHGTSDGRLIALDAATGALVDGFAAKGILALRDGIAEGRDISKRIYGITSAPAIFEDLVIAGFAVDEGPARRCPATSARSTRARARSAGASTPCRVPANSGTTRGRRRLEGSRRRERVERPRPSTNRAASSSPASAPRRSTSTAAIASATTCSATPRSRSTRAPVSGSGTSRRRATTSGTWTCRRRRSW